MEDHLKAKCFVKAERDAAIFMGIDADNDLEMNFTNTTDQDYIYADLDGISKLIRNLKKLRKGEIDSFDFPCVVSGEDVLVFENSPFGDWYNFTTYREGSTVLESAIDHKGIKQLRKELKGLRKIMREGAE